MSEETLKVFERVKKCLLKISPEMNTKKISLKSSLIEDLMVDSLKLAELSLLLEEEFHKTLSLHELFLEVPNPNEIKIENLVKHIHSVAV